MQFHKIKFENESQKPTNLKFIYNEKEYTSITQLEQDISGTINANEENKARTLKIDWNWPYETGSNENEIGENDKIDTKNASEIQNYTFNVIVSGTQVMPQE